VSKIRIDYENVDIMDYYSGHSMGVRSIELNKDATRMITGCEDHSLRVWDFKTGKPLSILSGHRDVVTGGVYLNPTTIASSSWDMKIMIWKI